MKSEKNKNQSCGCGCDFKHEIDNLVKEGQKPSHHEHLQREKDIEAAFGNERHDSDEFRHRHSDE